jgi:Mg-chelatase subunit ChlI
VLILVLNGEKGSAKTGTSRCLRSLVDPNLSSARAEPKDLGDLMIAAVKWVDCIVG